MSDDFSVRLLSSGWLGTDSSNLKVNDLQTILRTILMKQLKGSLPNTPIDTYFKIIAREANVASWLDQACFSKIIMKPCIHNYGKLILLYIFILNY
jgi:hypothetical protein